MTPDRTVIQFFDSPAAFRAWLKNHHAKARELRVGFHRKHTGRPSLTWPQSVAEALCYGWIDGIRRSVDAERYTIRFTPRRRGSKWSAVNVRMYGELLAAGRMKPAGRAAFEARPNPADPGYGYERRDATLDAASVKLFKQHTQAWEFFSAQPSGYRRLAAWYVMSAKRAETRQRRLRRLIDTSAGGKRLR